MHYEAFIHEIKMHIKLIKKWNRLDADILQIITRYGIQIFYTYLKKRQIAFIMVIVCVHYVVKEILKKILIANENFLFLSEEFFRILKISISNKHFNFTLISVEI